MRYIVTSQIENVVMKRIGPTTIVMVQVPSFFIDACDLHDARIKASEIIDPTCHFRPSQLHIDVQEYNL